MLSGLTGLPLVCAWGAGPSLWGVGHCPSMGPRRAPWPWATPDLYSTSWRWTQPARPPVGSWSPPSPAYSKHTHTSYLTHIQTFLYSLEYLNINIKQISQIYRDILKHFIIIYQGQKREIFQVLRKKTCYRSVNIHLTCITKAIFKNTSSLF